MTPAVATLNLLLGVAYLGIGVLTLVDMKQSWRALGYSHFGVGFLALAWTCGPHHLVHGLHLAFEGRQAGPLDLVAVLVGLPFGVIWLALRVESFAGGRGDRFISGTPRWMAAAPSLAAAYVTAVVVSAASTVDRATLHVSSMVLPNVVLIGIYMTIGYVMLRTQLANRRPLGGWSLSGLTFMGVFPTCALMHFVYATYALTGRYGFDSHGLIAGWLSVPGGLYFLWAVRGLHHGSLRDWNTGAEELVVRPPARAR